MWSLFPWTGATIHNTTTITTTITIPITIPISDDHGARRTLTDDNDIGSTFQRSVSSPIHYPGFDVCLQAHPVSLRSPGLAGLV